MEINNDSKFEANGNPTEVSLLQFLQDANLPVHHFIKRKMDRIMYHQPFSSVTKNSIIAIKYVPKQFNEEGSDDCVRVFVKGAPEDIINSSERNFNRDGELKELCNEDKKMIKNDIVKDVFSKQSLRSIAIAFKDFTHQEWDLIKKDPRNFMSDHLLYKNKTFLTDLNLIAIFAMQDPIRPEVADATRLAKRGKIDVCLVSGDLLETAVQFAIKSNIVKERYAKNQDVCMTAKKFREKCGGFNDETKDIIYLEQFK
jgi:magnesium-transporting ATPase (P-type)